MVDYRCEIEFIPEGGGTLNSVTLPNGNNISKFNGGNISGSAIEYPKVGARPFIFGVSKFGEGAVFADEYNGYLSSVLSDSDGNCDFTMTITGSNIDNLTIHFDNIVNEYATQIQIDGKSYINDDTHFFITCDKSNTHTIKFTKWSRAISNIRFTAITIGLTLTFNQFNGLLSFTRGSQSMQDNTTPNYGALAQYGSIKLADYTGEINEIEELNMLTSGIKIRLYMDNELVGDYLFDTFDKENKTTYNIQLTDEIANWNNILINGESLQENITAYDFYLLLKNYYEADYEDLSPEMIDYLKSIIIKYFYLENGTLFEQWNKFCDITQMLVYKKQNGKIALRRLQ